MHSQIVMSAPLIHAVNDIGLILDFFPGVPRVSKLPFPDTWRIGARHNFEFQFRDPPGYEFNVIDINGEAEYNVDDNRTPRVETHFLNLAFKGTYTPGSVSPTRNRFISRLLRLFPDLRRDRGDTSARFWLNTEEITKLRTHGYTLREERRGF